MLGVVQEILGVDAGYPAQERQVDIGQTRGGMVKQCGRSGRRKGAPLPPAPDLDPAGAVRAAEADEVGEEEGVAAERQRGGRESAAAGRRVRERVELGCGRGVSQMCLAR